MLRKTLLMPMLLAACGVITLGSAARSCLAELPWPFIFPEQRTIKVRDPAELAPAPLPSIPAPPTVSNPDFASPPKMLSLDEAIHTALTQTRVVRVLQGTTAINSGRTIYDAGISNTIIDQQQAKFDPTLQVNNSWNRNELPVAIPDPGNPLNTLITGDTNKNYNLGVGVNKLNPLGGNTQVAVNTNQQNVNPGIGLPLNPQGTSNASIGYSQPFLQGRGIGPNMASIVIARIETERSYFQYKDALQEQVRGVAEAYWALVAARTELWARQRQVEQADEGYRLANARFVAAINNGAERAQSRVTLAQFRANLVTAQANALQREAALRNILGIPPADTSLIVPTTQPTDLRYTPEWNLLTSIAQERRPDLVELKLIIEADQQQLLFANNQALPRLDGVAVYRWNGLEGDTPSGNFIRSGAGQYTDWSLGVNFSVPLGLRQGRSNLRQSELIIARDQANLQQGLHNAVHQLATNVRSLDQAYEQYLAFKEAREAAKVNLDQQFAQFRANRVIFLNVLQAIVDWGNSISSEAAALTAYNTQLANLERQSGTILETHGVTFYEERFGSISPWGRAALPASYPSALPPSENGLRYLDNDTTKPAEEKFDLQNPNDWKRQPLVIPAEEIPGAPGVPNNGVPNDPVPANPTVPQPNPSLPLPPPEAPPTTPSVPNGNASLRGRVQQASVNVPPVVVFSDAPPAPAPRAAAAPSTRPYQRPINGNSLRLPPGAAAPITTKRLPSG